MDSQEVLLCRSVAELGGAHSIFRCVSIIRRDRWPPGLVTCIYKFFPTPLKRRRPGATQKEITDRTARVYFNGAIPATTDKGELSLPPATAAATTRSIMQILRPTRPPLQPVANFGGEFVCWHAFLASRRIDCQAADFAVGPV